jgi:hypothetical protein
MPNTCRGCRGRERGGAAGGAGAGRGYSAQFSIAYTRVRGGEYGEIPGCGHHGMESMVGGPLVDRNFNYVSVTFLLRS